MQSEQKRRLLVVSAGTISAALLLLTAAPDLWYAEPSSVLEQGALSSDCPETVPLEESPEVQPAIEALLRRLPEELLSLPAGGTEIDDACGRSAVVGMRSATMLAARVDGQPSRPRRTRIPADPGSGYDALDINPQGDGSTDVFFRGYDTGARVPILNTPIKADVGFKITPRDDGSVNINRGSPYSADVNVVPGGNGSYICSGTFAGQPFSQTITQQDGVISINGQPVLNCSELRDQRALIDWMFPGMVDWSDCEDPTPTPAPTEAPEATPAPEATATTAPAATTTPGTGTPSTPPSPGQPPSGPTATPTPEDDGGYDEGGYDDALPGIDDLY